MSRLPGHVLKHVTAARDHATLATANFNALGSKYVIACDRTGTKFYGSPLNVDTFVKEAVRIHHDSWIIAPLERVLAWAKG